MNPASDPTTGRHDRPRALDLAERVVAYLAEPPSGEQPVIDHLGPEALAAAFAASIPIELADEAPPRTTDELRAAIETVIQHSVHTSHPRFFNQNFAGADPVAVVGDWLGAALNTTNATFEAAPVFTLMEAALLDKLARTAGYAVDPAGPPPGLFAPGGSTATLYALQLARHRREPDLVRRGAGAEPQAVFVSSAGHYATTKSAVLLGLGSDAVVEVASDDGGAMVPDALATAIADAVTSGRVPLAVVATAGTTVTGAFDPLPPIVELCRANGLWLHVDGCYGGSALFSAAQRHRLDGIGEADSFVWNLHKMMGVTQQCTALLLRDPAQLGPCFAIGADYLFQPDKLHGDLDSGDRHFQCARRVDALKLWLAWQSAGDAGFEARIDRAVALADHVRRRVTEHPRLEVMAPGDYTNVVFAWRPPEVGDTPVDQLPQGIRARLHQLPPTVKARMQADGYALLGFQPVDGLNVFRLLFINPEASEADADGVLDYIDRVAAEEW